MPTELDFLCKLSVEKAVPGNGVRHSTLFLLVPSTRVQAAWAASPGIIPMITKFSLGSNNQVGGEAAG